MRSVKVFILISCMSFLLSLFWLQFLTKLTKLTVNESLIDQAIKNVKQNFIYSNINRNTNHLSENIKYILLWNRKDLAPFTFFEEGQRSFLENNCSNFNCYVTWNKTFFGGNYTKFHAIAFNGRNLKPNSLPNDRSRHQKYIFFNMEPSDIIPICHSKFDGFFNLTATYKLDSDIPIPYMLIKDKNGNIVGPKRDMYWITEMEKMDTDYTANKTKFAAWFVSNCKARSNRTGFVNVLQQALQPYAYNIDVFGKCGNIICPRSKAKDCEFMLKRDYFFYMSLENSFCADYVTEKLLTALNNNVVPIVYGGADYSRFLPPGSYIDGRKQNSEHQLAALMGRLAQTPKEYNKYFKWKQYYTYDSPMVENICKICKSLNDNTLMEKTTIYNRFRSWWHPNYKRRCF